MEQPEKVIRNRIKNALNQYNLYYVFRDMIDDIYQEIVLYRLEGKSQHQFIRHFVLDFLIKNRKLMHYSMQQKEKVSPSYPKIYHVSQFLESYGQRDNGIEREVDRKMLFESAKKILNKYDYKIFSLYILGYKQKDIGKKLKVSEARICQNLKEIKDVLRNHIRDKNS